MTFRLPKYLEKYDYVSFNLDTSIKVPDANELQKLNGYRFSIENGNSPHPYDFYHAFIAVKFRVQRMDGTDLADNEAISTVNSIYSFFEKVIFKFNGVVLNQSPNINKCMWVKNLLKYSKPYETAASNSFDYFDYSRNTTTRLRTDNFDNYAADVVAPATNINPGFRKRHLELVGDKAADAIISLNRYGFFKSLKSEILPQGTVSIDITLESSDNLIYRTGGVRMKVIFTHMMLYVPKLIFNGLGDDLFLTDYLKAHSWPYLRESFNETVETQATSGSFVISTSIKQPRHVFVWGILSARENSQVNNVFFAETFSMGANAVHVNSAQLELGGGNYYPLEVLNPWENLGLTYRELMSFAGYYDDPLSGPQITFKQFRDLYSILYFNLNNQPETLRSGDTKLTFRWQLDGAPGSPCKFYAVVLNEETIRISKERNHVTLKN